MRASSMCDPDKLSQRAYEDVNGSSTTMYSYNQDQCKRQHFHLCASTEFACMGSDRLFVPFNQRRVQWKKQTCIRYRSSFRVFEVEVSQLCNCSNHHLCECQQLHTKKTTHCRASPLTSTF